MKERLVPSSCSHAVMKKRCFTRSLVSAAITQTGRLFGPIPSAKTDPVYSLSPSLIE